MERRIRREVEEMLDEFGRLNGKAINPTQLTVASVLNVIVSIIFGKRYPITDPKLEKVITIVRNMALEVVDPMMINFFPFLRYLPKYKRVIQECLDRDEAMNGLLEEGIQESLSGVTEESFISCFVQEGGPDYDHKQLLLTLRDLFLAGTETTATTLPVVLVVHGKQSGNPGTSPGGDRRCRSKIQVSISGR